MFIINLVPLHAFVLILMGRFSVRLYVGKYTDLLLLLLLFTFVCLAYTTFFILGLIMSMQIPFVGFQPIRTSEHMAAAGETINRFIRLIGNLFETINRVLLYNISYCCV